PEYLFTVKRGSFMPIPGVDSAVIKLHVHAKKLVSPKDEQLFKKVVRTAFSQRRKMVLNTLSSLTTKQKMEQILVKCGISLSARAENLTLSDFSAISDEISIDK
ncbi:MAG: rRNA adenine N-6-methyltransferase family protein, partial [Hydrogenoanaerobacterium sp.]